jgi:hypothetical protein
VNFLVENRAAGAALWVVLHTLDYYLTLWSVVIHRAGADKSYDVGGSVELNPIMEGALERKSRVSWRFVLTLVGGAVALWFLQPLAVGEDPDFWPFMLGIVLFTRLAVIGQHVHNIVFFKAVVRGEIVGQLKIPRKKTLQLSTLRYGTEALLVVAGALVSNSPWLWGGAVAMSFLVLMIAVRAAWEWFRTRKRSA